MLLVTLISILLALLVFKCMKTYLQMRRIDNMLKYIPGPQGLPIVRNFFDFNRIEKVIPHGLKYQKQYGGLVKVNLFLCVCAVIITDYKLLEYLLSTTFVLNKTMTYNFLHNWIGDGLLTSKTEKWRKTRKIITPAFHFHILEQYVDVFRSASDVLIKNLRKKIGQDAFDIYPFITLCTLDIICETAMGTKINAQENFNSEYVQSVKSMCRIIIERTMSPWKMFDTLYLLSRDYWEEKRHLKVIHGFTNSVIRKRREELISRKGDEATPKRKLAFLDLILQSSIDGRPMTDDEIRQEVDTFMFEGHDTTASGICFILYCLSKHTNVQQKVFNELQNLFGDDRGRAVTYKDLQEMKYLEMVIKETFRLYPPVPIFSREADKDTTYHGRILPAGSQLGIFTFGVHRNPEYYSQPEIFDPERFTPENISMRPPFSYLAFSAGPRNCIGQKFAMLELKMVVAKILRNFRIVGVENFEPKLAPLVVLRSLNGILIKLEERVQC